MEELVALQAEPIGVQDRAKAPPIRITRGEVRFDRVSFRYWDAIGAGTLHLEYDLHQ
jgi:ABC-type transport system involved in Fe-S cluster assembly fused permease/ATPase subunit